MKEISGTMYEYYFVCVRKLWYFSHDITMESENENVQIGKLIDESSYREEEKHISIGTSAAIDYLKNHIVVEVKKSSRHNESAIAQIKYYLYLLRQSHVDMVAGELRIPKENKIISVTLEPEDIVQVEENCRKIHEIMESPAVPAVSPIPICKSCAYYELCYI